MISLYTIFDCILTLPPTHLSRTTPPPRFRLAYPSPPPHLPHPHPLPTLPTLMSPSDTKIKLYNGKEEKKGHACNSRHSEHKDHIVHNYFILDSPHVHFSSDLLRVEPCLLLATVQLQDTTCHCCQRENFHKWLPTLTAIKNNTAPRQRRHTCNYACHF